MNPTLLLTTLALALAVTPSSSTEPSAMDHDGDHVPTIMESPDGDGDPTNDDTDLNGMPDYLDLDDDGDGLWTWPDEDVDGDGDPTNDDSDADGIPDYLDAADTVAADPLPAAHDCTCDGDRGGDDDLLDEDAVFESGAACTFVGAAGVSPWLLLPTLLIARRRRTAG